MPSFSVTRTYSAQAVRAKSWDSRTLMPPKRTKGAELEHSIVGVTLIMVVAKK
ncbi:hypothetical protein D3C77_679210 [compost metagenome]